MSETQSAFHPEQPTSFTPTEVGVFHELPAYYTTEFGEPVEDVGQHMLESLHNQFMFGPQDPKSMEDLTKNAYAVVQNVGESTLYRENEVAFKITDAATRAVSSALNFNSSTQRKDWGGSVVAHSLKDGVSRPADFNMDYDDLHAESTQIQAVEQRLAREGVTDIPAEQVSFFMFVRTVAHEAAHITGTGIGILGGKYGAEGFNFVADAHFRDNPDEDVVGNPANKVETWNERFAEGYANLVLAQTLARSGYSIDQKAAMVKAMQNDKMDDKHIGYSTPLNSTQIIEALVESDRAVKGQQ